MFNQILLNKPMKFVVLKFFKFKWPEVNSAPNRQNKTKQKNTTRQYTARFQYLHKISNPRRDEGIILQRKTLHCLWVPAHRQPKTFSQYKWSRILFCGTEWRKWWSKTAFVYKNLNLISRSERTNYELPTYRDDYFLRRLKLQSYPEAVRFP